MVTATKQRRRPSLFGRIIGVIGELLITAGVVLGLFIVWQVWWTDIGANRAQSEQVQQLQNEYGEVEQKAAPAQPGPPPAWDSVPALGEPFGVMRIPRFGAEYAYSIANGTDLETVLDKGSFGHYEETQMPGEVGNFALAAHRQTYGAPMRAVEDLQNGDPIVIELPDRFLVYKVVEHEIVLPSAVWTISPDPFAAPEYTGALSDNPERRLLTITTCHPPFVSNERWIVHAEFDYWTLRSDGLPQALIDQNQGE